MSGKSGSRKTVNPGWFSKGSSPNPGGRPTASPAPQPSAFQVLVEKTLTVTDRAGTREITIEETLQQQTYQRALNGDRMASREVLKWISLGKFAWEIGEVLGIAKRTVDEHAQTAVRKLGASNRTHAVAIAIRDCLIDI